MAKRKSATQFNQQPASPLDALIRQLDIVAVEMETKWGMGVLHGLCTPETSAKFMRVKDALDDAIQSGDYDLVKAKSESLIRGWQQMEKEAIAAKPEKPWDAQIWFCCSPQMGIEYIVCKSELDAARAAAMYPARASAIHTLADIAKMIESGSVVNLEPKIKIELVKKAKTPNEILLSDEVPF